MNEQQVPPQQEQKMPAFFPRDPEYGAGNMKPVCGIVGHGFVGKAVERALDPEVERFLVDPNYSTTIDQLIEQQPFLVFVCTPTPTSKTGRIDAAVTLDSILKLLKHTQAGIVLKSTVTPDIIERVVMTANQMGTVDRLIYAPEFLTEKNADYEYCNPKYMVLGGLEPCVNEFMGFLQECSYVTFPKNTDGGIHVVNPMEASYVKYAINAFLAMKVTFFNQLNDALSADSFNVNSIKVLKTLACETRLGGTHWRVPGPDGKKGFGGACFPKDVSALTTFSDKFSLLEKVTEINNEYRKEYDLDSREVEQNISFDKGEEDVSNGQVEEELESQDSSDAVTE